MPCESREGATFHLIHGHEDHFAGGVLRGGVERPNEAHVHVAVLLLGCGAHVDVELDVVVVGVVVVGGASQPSIAGLGRLKSSFASRLFSGNIYSPPDSRLRMCSISRTFFCPLA